MVGDYKTSTLPGNILEHVSIGLTKVDEQGAIVPGLAASWKVLEDGKRYEFFLKEKLKFTDGKLLDSSQIQYNFSDATIERPSQYAIVFKLKDSYSPFLLSVSRPVFRNGFVGVGDYIVKKIELNGEFVKSLSLYNKSNSLQTISYQFYPSQDALKIAFLLGEVDQARGLTDTNYESTEISLFPNVITSKITNYNRLVTIFYNTKDSGLSDDKIRNALTHSLPNSFSKGERNSRPFSKKGWAGNDGTTADKTQDLKRAEELLSSSTASKSAQFAVHLKVFKKYKSTAEEVAREWKKVNVETKIEEVTTVPSDFQVFLGDFPLEKDPDQYFLWHSSSPQNITNYQDLRIDKLLEDGRQTTDISKRKKIYEDFQKYLLVDSPASFLFFPYEYDLMRK